MVELLLHLYQFGFELVSLLEDLPELMEGEAGPVRVLHVYHHLALQL